MIPKKIHWCWLSGEPLPEGAKGCMGTWQLLEGYESRQWAMGDAQKMPLPPVIKQALELKEWAIAADYVRLHAVYAEGGVYFDSDVIVAKPLPDEMLGHRFFTSVECFGFVTGLQAAIFGAEPGHPFVKSCMDWYWGLSEGGIGQVLSHEIIAPHVFAKIAEGYGFNGKNEAQYLPEGIAIYQHDALAGFHDQVTANTVAWHVCHGSWRKKGRAASRLLIGVPTCRGVKPETIECLWSLDTSMFGCADLLISRNGYGVARNKNMIATKAIDEGYDYIFTVDDDMTFPPDTLARLLALDSGIASAWAMQLDGTTNICRFDAENKSYACMRSDEIPQGMFLDDAYAIVKADAVGIACTLIKTGVYRSQGYPYHVYCEYPNKTLLSEDLYFCDQLRAYRPDVTIKVDLSLKAGHIKQAIL